MAGELVVRGGGALKKAAKKGALKKAAKKGALKKAAAKKSAGKKAASKKAAGKKGVKQVGPGAAGADQARAFHHLQRAVALLSLLEQDSGGDLRMLLDAGIGAYRREVWEEAAGLLRAAEHLGMAGLYAARADYRVAVKEPVSDDLEKKLDRVAACIDDLEDFAGEGIHGRLYAMAAELLKRAEAADHDFHLAWELVGAADGLCAGLNGTGV